MVLVQLATTSNSEVVNLSRSLHARKILLKNISINHSGAVTEPLYYITVEGLGNSNLLISNMPVPSVAYSENITSSSRQSSNDYDVIFNEVSFEKKIKIEVRNQSDDALASNISSVLINFDLDPRDEE